MTYNQKLPPFKWFILENFPYIEDDFDALTNYQLFCKLGKELNKIIKKLNLTGEQVENLTNAFDDLKNYVDNYFENLDIQSEVDTKLDEMAQSGELADLIAQYLEAQAIIGFNNCSSLGGATNLASGSFARTLGRYTYNDGYGAFYKIRTRTNADVPDGYNVITLTETENLVAERIVDARKKILIFGDSWSMNDYPYISDQNNMWFRLYAKKLNLRVQSYAESGAGYTVENNTFLSQVNTAIENENPDDIVKIIVYGGINDLGSLSDYGSLYSPCTTLLSALKTAFPNSEIIVCGINIFDEGCTTNMEYVKNTLHDATISSGCRFIDTIPFMLGYSSLFDVSTNHHPNGTGQIFLSGCMASAIEGTYKKPDILITTSPYEFSKTAEWVPDLTSSIIYQNDRMKLLISTTVSSAFNSPYQAIYTCTNLNFNTTKTNSLLLVDRSNPENKVCTIVSRPDNNKIGIYFPSGVTGTFEGYIDIPY